MEFGVLGPLNVRTPRGPVKVVGARQRRLLAALICHGSRVVGIDRLIDIVFEGDPPRGAATTIRSYVARLRRSLASGEPEAESLIVTQASGYLLHLTDCQVDADRFLTMTESGKRQFDDGDAVAAVATLRDALELWRGEAYQEFTDEEWARPEILRLAELRVLAEVTVVDAQLECGLNDEVVADLRRLIDRHPLRDRFRSQLALALYRAGRQAEALRSLRAYRETLVEVGLEPSDELAALQRSIAAHDPALRLATPAGRRLRGYRLDKMLGRGRHGHVYRAIQPGSSREVAVKAIPPDVADNPDLIRGFDAYAQLVCRLEHPHIAPIHDAWREPGGAYVVMRLLPRDLSEDLGAGPMDVGRAARLAEQAGAALTAAHRAGAIHGDIKPSKVRVDGMDAYLSGFAIASVVCGTGCDHMPSGRSGYESPERLAGEAPSPAGDQYSLAVLLGHALTGVLPFGQRGIASPHDRSPSIHVHRPAVPAAVDEVLWKATSWNPEDRYPDVGVFVDEFVAALEGKARPAPTDVFVTNPYRGLRAFTETDSAVFFGRDAVVEELLGRLSSGSQASRFVVLVGASGSGKSSIVRAGVVPRLRAGGVPGAEDWFIATMVPGSRPFAKLTAALRSIASGEPAPITEQSVDGKSVEQSLRVAVPGGQPVLLVVDQLEELFTAVSEESVRKAFLDGLARVVNDPSSNVRIVATLRADYYDRPLRYHQFGGLVKAGTVTVAGMTAAELEEAITEPAAHAGVEVEPALATQIVADVVDQPAALPLLQFTLTELFEQREGRAMSVASYRKLGGVEAAVARRADQLLQRRAREDQELARRMFLRLLTVDESGMATRRRALRSELLSLATDPAEVDRIVDVFGEARLLTFDHDPTTRGPTVEVAHEALIGHWSRLGRWVAEAGAGLRIQGHLTEAATSWELQGRDPSDLYRGGRLESALEWSWDQPGTASSVERQFLAASVELRDAEAGTERQRLEQQRRANRRLRILLGGVAVALTLALIAGFLAVNQWRAAQQEARQETARQLTASSALALEEDPELAILLAMEAVDVSRSAGESVRGEAMAALQEAVQTSRLELRLEEGTGNVDVSADGSLMAGVVYDREEDQPSNEVAIWDAASGDRLRTLVGEGTVVDLAFSPGGHLLMAGYAVGGADDHIVLWDPGTGRPMSRLPGALGGNWSPDGELLAATAAIGGDALAATVWQVDDEGTETESQSFSIGFLAGLTFVDDTTLAVGDLERERVVFYDALTGEETGDLDIPGFTPLRLRLDAAHNRLVAGGSVEGAAVVQAWDLDTRSPVWSTPVADGFVEVSPETGVVASFGRDGQVRLHDPEDGTVVATLDGHTGAIIDVAFYPDGERLASTAQDGETRVWDIASAGPRAIGITDLGTNLPFAVAVAPDTTEAAVQSVGAIQRVDLVTAGLLQGSVTGLVEWDFPAPVSSDWRLVAALDDDGRGWIRDLATGDALSELPRCMSPRSLSADGRALILDGRALCSPESQPDVELRSRVVEVTSGRELLDLGERPILGGSGAAFSPAGDVVPGRHLAIIVDDEQIVEIYDIASGDLVADTADFIGHDPIALAFDPTGRYLAIGTQNGGASVLDLLEMVDGASARKALVFNEVVDTGGVPGVALNAEGVLATSAFNSLRLWDIHTGGVLNELTVEIDTPPFAAFSPEGDSLFYTDGNPDTGYVLRQVRLDIDQLIELAQSRITRGFTDDECRRYEPASCRQ
jgi:DNA-binding SARP family transcriptional activator/WD40 repeat protein